MKKWIIAMLVVAMLLSVLTACGDGTSPMYDPKEEQSSSKTEPEKTEPEVTDPQETDPEETDPQETDPIETEPEEDNDFDDLVGCWASRTENVSLEINDAGQVWYKIDGEVAFRGYLVRVELEEDDPAFDYTYRFDFYNNVDIYLESYCIASAVELISMTEDGTVTDHYDYAGIGGQEPDWSGEDYRGIWQYGSGEMLVIDEYDEWNLYDTEMGLMGFGTVVFTEDGARLELYDGSVVGQVCLDENGCLVDDGEVLTPCEELPGVEPDVEPNVDDIFVDAWCVYGDLNAEFLYIQEDGLWELRATEAEGAGIICLGYVEMNSEGYAQLYDDAGALVAMADIMDNELTLDLEPDFEWVFQAYGLTSMWFYREADSVYFEA